MLTKKLEDKIRLAVPESMEHRWLTDNRVESDLCMYCDGNSKLPHHLCDGRPLNLQDVLIACKERELWVAVTEAGNFGRCEVGGNLKEFVWYDLTKDFYHQSDETYQFLYDILCT